MYCLKIINKCSSWFKDNDLHRGGFLPAISYSDGRFEYWMYGFYYVHDEKNDFLFHGGLRLNKFNFNRISKFSYHPGHKNSPSVIYRNGTKEWHFFGELHRKDAPAVIYGNGDYEYWKKGKRNGITFCGGKKYLFERGEFVKCIV
jgi:hypothetical protein